MTPVEAAELLRRARAVVGRRVGKRSPIHDDLVSEVLLRVLEARSEAPPHALLGTITRRHAPRTNRLLHPLGRAQARGVPPAVLPFDTGALLPEHLHPEHLHPDPYAVDTWRYRVHQRLDALLGGRHELQEALAMMLGAIEGESSNSAYHRRSKLRQMISADPELAALLEECP